MVVPVDSVCAWRSASIEKRKTEIVPSLISTAANVQLIFIDVNLTTFWFLGERKNERVSRREHVKEFIFPSITIPDLSCILRRIITT